MRTNDNAVAVALILGIIAFGISAGLFINAVLDETDTEQLKIRVAELEKVAAINQLSNTHLLKILGSLTNIVGELERRLHPTEVKQ